MQCPNCSQTMEVLNCDNEIILHCKTCGSSFFDLGGIKHITAGSARRLADDAQGHYVLGNEKLCPKDHTLLIQKIDDPAVPQNTVILECSTCHGVFAYPDDLLKYKGIKDPTPISPLSMKLLPAPKTIFMLGLFAVFSLGIFMNYGAISRSLSLNSKADEMIKKVYTASDSQKHYLFFDFTTENAVTSQIKFTDRTTGKEIVKDVSSKPQKVHHLTTTELDLTHNLFYQIILSGNNPGAERKLELK